MCGHLALSEAQKERILQCIEQGMSNRAIADVVSGVSYETVRKYRQKLSGTKVVKKKVVNKVVTETPARANKEDPPVMTISNPTTPRDRDKMAGEVLSDLDLICDVARDGMGRAKRIKEDEKRTWMEVQYAKLLKDAIRIKGTWAGLDSMVEGDNTTLKAYAEGLKRFEKTDPEGWEVKS